METLRVCHNSPFSDKVRMFNSQANKHQTNQALNPFSNDKVVGSLPRPKFEKSEYGRPPRGSLSETRGFKATIQVCKEMLQLCEVINEHAEPLFNSNEQEQNDYRKIISFGELFDLYTTISSKVVGILLRTRKQNLVDFEGEVLFQRRDDDVPIILLKPIGEIRTILNEKIEEASNAIKQDEFSE